MIYRLTPVLVVLGFACAGLSPPAGAVTNSDRWVVVNADGAKIRGYGVVSTKQYSRAARYEIVFNRNVAGCAYTATVASLDDSFPQSGFALVAPRTGNPRAVAVATVDPDGTPTSLPFHLSVSCKP